MTKALPYVAFGSLGVSVEIKKVERSMFANFDFKPV
jgi:hypothetical protein